MHFEWLTFDEWYGSKPSFLRGLQQRQQKFIGEVPKCFMAWIDPPRTTQRPYRRGRRGPFGKKLGVRRQSAPQTVERLANGHPSLKEKTRQTWRVKDGQKGPMVWKAKHVLVFLKDENGLPIGPFHLLVCRNPVTDVVKYLVSNAPPETPLGTLLRVAFSRWRVERRFEDHKGEVGLDHWEGRRWIGLK